MVHSRGPQCKSKELYSEAMAYNKPIFTDKVYFISLRFSFSYFSSDLSNLFTQRLIAKIRKCFEKNINLLYTLNNADLF